mgnify:FL=1
MASTIQHAWGKEHFEVLGGQITPDHCQAFLKAWQWPEEKRWGVWEFVSDFEMNSGALPPPEKFAALERVDLFGRSGHLSARRDGGIVLWHFVGEVGLLGTPEQYQAESYWKAHPEDTFTRQELKSAMLWGRKEGAVWQDDRVGWAKLVYPGASAPHVLLKYWQFTHAGQVAFVWMTGLQDAEEA